MIIRIQTVVLTIWLILSVPGTLGAEKVGHCAYQPKKSLNNPNPELTPFTNCGEISEGGKLVLTKEHFNNIHFDDNGLACLYVKGLRVFYVHKSGKTMEAQYFDNGCDYFKEGLARGKLDEKVVFFNKKLEVMIRTDFDSASPFKKGYAAVCNGGYAEKIGEHTFMRGGKCGYIDRFGKVVVPLAYSRENLPPINMIGK